MAVVVISRMGRRKVFKNLYFINNFRLKEISGGGGSQQWWFLYLLYRDLEPWWLYLDQSLSITQNCRWCRGRQSQEPDLPVRYKKKHHNYDEHGFDTFVHRELQVWAAGDLRCRQSVRVERRRRKMVGSRYNSGEKEPCWSFSRPSVLWAYEILHIMFIFILIIWPQTKNILSHFYGQLTEKSHTDF